MAVDISKFNDDDLLVYGQVPITKEEYLQMARDGVDLSIVHAQGEDNAVPSVSKEPDDNDMDIIMSSIQTRLEELSDASKTKVEYEYNSGHDNTEVSPYSKGVAKLDEDSFLGWTSYELGYISSDLAIDTTDIILSSGSFEYIGEETTSSDTSDYKRSLFISEINIGDIIMFDTNKPDGLSGFYLGAGNFVTLYPGAGSDVSIQSVMTTMDDGETIYTEWMDRFNGNVYRAKRISGGGYEWYNSTINN